MAFSWVMFHVFSSERDLFRPHAFILDKKTPDTLQKASGVFFCIDMSDLKKGRRQREEGRKRAGLLEKISALCG